MNRSNPNLKHLLRLFVGGIVLSGCSVGPDYVRPEITLPDAFGRVEPAPIEPLPTVAAEQQALATWWKSFNDETLSRLVAETLAANLDLAQARSRLRQARAQRRIAVAGLFPQIGASADYTRRKSEQPASDLEVSDPMIEDTDASSINERSSVSSSARGLYQAGLDASWEIDVFGGSRRSVEAASADLLRVEEELRSTRTSLVAEVAASYFDLRTAQAQVQVTERNLDSQIRTAALIEERFASGFASGLDRANAQATVSSTRARLPEQQTAVTRAMQSLALLLGRLPNTLSDRLASPTPLPAQPSPLATGMPSELLTRRPDIRAADAALQAATARVGVAMADYFPRFSLTGSFVYSGGSIGELVDGETRTWAFGPSVRWSVFEAGRVQANVESQRAALEQAELAYEQAILIAFREVEGALAGIRSTEARASALREAKVQSAKAVELSKQLYAAGMVDFLEVLVAERSYYAAEAAVIDSDRTALEDLIALYKSLGGGW